MTLSHDAHVGLQIPDGGEDDRTVMMTELAGQEVENVGGILWSG